MDMRTSRDEIQLADWLKKACEGDEASYRAFMQSVSEIIRGVIRAKAGGLALQEQEDILQDVLLAIHSKRDTWRQDHPVKPWVYAIGRYKIIDAFRRRGRAQFVDIEGYFESIPAEEVDVSVGMDVEVLVRQLPPKQEKVVRLIAIDGLNIQDVSRRLGMRETAVRVNFHRGLERLRIMSAKDDQ